MNKYWLFYLLTWFPDPLNYLICFTINSLKHVTSRYFYLCDSVLNLISYFYFHSYIMFAITFLPGSIQKLGSTSSMNVAMSPSGSLTLDLALGTFVALVFWWYSNWKKRSLSLIPLLTTVNYYASFISASLLFLSFTLSDILFLRCQTLFFSISFSIISIILASILVYRY